MPKWFHCDWLQPRATCLTDEHVNFWLQSHRSWITFALQSQSHCAFSALMLFVGWQEGHPAWCAGMVVCLERGADLYMTQLMPLPLTVSCFSKIEIVLPLWYRITQVVQDKGLLNGCVCVCHSHNSGYKIARCDMVSHSHSHKSHNCAQCLMHGWKTKLSQAGSHHSNLPHSHRSTCRAFPVTAEFLVKAGDLSGQAGFKATLNVVSSLRKILKYGWTCHKSNMITICIQ